MTAHPVRRFIQKMTAVPRPSGKIKDPLPKGPNPRETIPIPLLRPQLNIMTIVGIGLGPLITTPGDIPGLSNILHTADSGKSDNPTIDEVLKGKKRGIKRAPLPPGSPS